MPRADAADSYIDAVIKEWHMRRTEINELFTTLYIGGGTPSILPACLLKRLIDGIALENLEEFTIEANPEDVTPQWVSSIRNIGINRVSIGIQSFSDAELKVINRRHTGDDAEKRCIHCVITASTISAAILSTDFQDKLSNLGNSRLTGWYL